MGSGQTFSKVYQTISDLDNHPLFTSDMYAKLHGDTLYCLVSSMFKSYLPNVISDRAITVFQYTWISLLKYTHIERDSTKVLKKHI